MLILQKRINSTQKNSEIKDHTLRLCIISKDFTINTIKKNRIKSENFFSVDFNPIDNKDILGNYRYLMKVT